MTWPRGSSSNELTLLLGSGRGERRCFPDGSVPGCRARLSHGSGSSVPDRTLNR
jgi:hypothetical protein